MLQLLRSLGYLLYLAGAAVGGFPPPRLFAREELPEEVIVRVLDDQVPDEPEGIVAEWGLRVTRRTLDGPFRPAFPMRTPREPSRPRS